MKRIVFFIVGFLLLYSISVVVLNLLPEKKSKAPQETPQIQIQNPETSATPSAETDQAVPDL